MPHRKSTTDSNNGSSDRTSDVPVKDYLVRDGSSYLNRKGGRD